MIARSHSLGLIWTEPLDRIQRSHVLATCPRRSILHCSSTRRGWYTSPVRHRSCWSHNRSHWLLLLEIAGSPNFLTVPWLNCEVEDDDQSESTVSRAFLPGNTEAHDIKHHSLAPLNSVRHKSRQLDDDVLVQHLVIHKMVELSGKHRLNEVFPVGKDDSVIQESSAQRLGASGGASPVSIKTRSTRCVYLFHAQNLQDRLHIVGRLSSLIHQLAKSSGKRRRHGIL